MSKSKVNPLVDPISIAGDFVGGIFNLFKELAPKKDEEIQLGSNQIAQQAFAEYTDAAYKQQEETEKELAKMQEEIENAKNEGNVAEGFSFW
jgi:flagellar biosynthesis/type III secretory pathway protein FliH